MATREQLLDEFIHALECAARAATNSLDDEDPRRAMVQTVFSALEGVEPAEVMKALELDACRHLSAALMNAESGPEQVAYLARAFEALAPALCWRLRPPDLGEDPKFRGGHANADIIGPTGLGRHDDIVLGVSLMAPGVTYPDHNHPPEEIYIVMSKGDWFSEKEGWYTPSVGEVIHHRPNIVHAMCSGAEPLLAVWCLKRP